MGWLIAIAGAVVGALAAGLADWLLERRRERVESAAALVLLERNLQEARASLRAALAPEVNWWWPALEQPRICAWEEQRVALTRRLSAETLAIVAESADRLRSIDNWAAIQRERQERREEDVTTWIQANEDRLTDEDSARVEATVERFGPSLELGKRERSALENVLAKVDAAVEGVARRPSPLRFVRSWKLWAGVAAACVAVALGVVLVSASRPDFTAESLAGAVARQLDRPSMVSCEGLPGRDTSWRCVAGWATAGHSCGAGAEAVDVGATRGALLAAVRPSCSMSVMERFHVMKAEREDCFMALKTGAEPPSRATVEPASATAGTEPARTGFTPTPPVGRDATLAGCVP